MKPAQRGLGVEMDNLETVGGRDRYVRTMVTHQDRMARVRASIDSMPPKAAFGGDDRKMADLCMTMGCYHAVSTILNMFEVALPAGEAPPFRE